MYNGGIYRFIALSLAMSIPASGETVFLASSNQTLYRVTVSDGGSLSAPDLVETFQLDDEINSYYVNPLTGQVMGIGAGEANVYELVNAASGVPSLSLVTQFPNRIGSATQIGQTVYGSRNPLPGEAVDNLYAIDVSDISNPVESVVGQMGIGTAMAGFGYDSDTGTMWGASKNADRLYVIDPGTAAASEVGFLGHSSNRLGLEWFDGVLYMSSQNESTGNYELGTLDPSTGIFSSSLVLGSLVLEAKTGLAVIPEPSTAAAFLMLGVMVLRKLR